MEMTIGACGCICSDCRLFQKSCEGYHAIKGKECWLNELGLDICDFYECCVINKEFEHCGDCPEIPCKKF